MPGFTLQVSGFRLQVSAFAQLRSIAVACCRLLSLALVVVSLVGPASGATFDEQRKAVAVSPATQPESAIMSLLKAGLEQGKPVLAITEAEKWLRQNQPEKAILLYHAARAAELSGDWRGAVALYQQYLEQADLNSETADEAVYAVYSLLLDRLNDPSAAYSFSRNKGGRLLTCPRAKQFDKWFLDEAVRRRDPLAVAKRLHACIEAGLPTDLMSARYDNYFRWLLGVADTSVVRGAITMTDDLAAAFKRLTAAMSFNEELKLRLDWASAVLAYNQDRLADKDAAPPLAEAKALLAKYPRHALWVQTGWAGGNRDIHPHYVGDVSTYWPQEIDAKIAPIIAAASKLGPLQRAELMQSWRPGYYRRQRQEPQLVKLESLREYLAAHPEIMRQKIGPLVLQESWDRLRVERLKDLAPKLAQNSHPEASLIRAVAAGTTVKNVETTDGDEGADGKPEKEYTKDYDKMMAALLGSEVWRLGARELGGHYADRLWHYCGRPGGNEKRDAMIAKAKKMAEQLKKPDVKKDDSEGKRLAMFRKLWKDYRSPQPEMANVYGRLTSVLMFTPEAVPELLRDPSPAAQKLARHALANGTSRPNEAWKALEKTVSVNTHSYAPGSSYLINRHRGMDRIKKAYPKKCRPHPLEDELRKHLSDELKRNKLEPWQVLAWINMQWPEDNAEQVKLMQQMFTSPAWQTMPFEVKFAAREWFKKDAMTPSQVAWIDAADPALACKDLLELPKEADVETTAAALRKAIDGVKNSPVKINIQGLDKLAAVDNAVFTDPNVFNLVFEVTDNLRATVRADAFGGRLLSLAKANRDPVMMQRSAFYLWHRARHDARGYFFNTAQFVESLIDDSPATAFAMARMGEHVFTGLRSYGFNWQDGVGNLKATAGKAAMELGLVTIPVRRRHPSFPIYKSQSEWLIGNEKSAWAKLDENWGQLLPVHRELSSDYLMWALQRVIDQRDEDRQESLIKALVAWAGEKGSPLTPTEKAEIKIAYGDIAVQRGRLDDAHKLYGHVEEKKEYEGLLVRHRATLRKVWVERLAKNYGAALKTLKRLDMERVPEMWGPLRYARAEVYYDMQEYEDANDEIEKILTRQPNHAEAKILQGKVQLKREKLMEATEIEVGTVSSQKTLVPGEKLKVTLSDPTLAVSGAGVEVEVAVWTSSGDKERFFLRQFGDQKTKFRGAVETALGSPKSDDGTLQVIGDDKIYYGYSERFRKRLNDIPEGRGGPVTVSSDAALMASARKLLSPAQQRLADMEQMLKLNTDIDSLDSEERAALKAKAAASNRERLLQARVKPGSPIHLRVIDLDGSRTDGIDELTVSLESSSGDSIGRVVLKETGTHSGWFTGDVSTGRAQAMAFARNSEPGRNPNMVISPKTDYPAWRPVREDGVKPEFTVDLNDNVPLDELTVAAKEQGATLKKFALQTGMNRENMSLVAVYPEKADQATVEKPWHPSVTIMNDTDHHHQRHERSVYQLREIQGHLREGWLRQRWPQGVAENVAGPSAAMTPSIPAKVNWKRRNHYGTSHVIYRFRGYFHEPESVTRRFRVDLGKYKIPEKTHNSVDDPAQFLLAVDGQPITNEKKPEKLEGEIPLTPGVHRFEIWATGWNTSIGFGRDLRLLANLETPEKMTECPDSFFDPDTFPKGALPHRNAPAAITASQAGTEFIANFAPDSRARLIRLLFIDQDGPVPVLNRITLQQPDGDQVLPVPQDYAELNKNDTLEILTGDKVRVRYTDERFVSKNKKIHERFLNVAYSNASIEFADIEPRWSERHHEKRPYHERILRFEYNKPLPLVVHDPDMDMSVEPDNLTVTVENDSGDTREIKLEETAAASGTFRGFVTAISKARSGSGKNQIPVAKGGTLTMSYRDAENKSPGVPTERYARIRHAEYGKPVLKVAHATVTPFEPDPGEGWPTKGLIRGFTPVHIRQARQARDEIGEQQVLPVGAGSTRVRWLITNDLLPVDSPPDGGFQAVHGRRLHLEIVAPHLARRARSKVTVYAQTESGRKRARKQTGGDRGPQAPEQNNGFDLSVPGTQELHGVLASQKLPNSPDQTPEIATYMSRNQWSHRRDEHNRRFKLSVPLVADMLPEYGILTPEERERRRDRGRWQPVYGLVVQPNDRIHVGFRYTDGNGNEKWLTTSAKVITHPVLDAMEEGYRIPQETVYVGETLFLRVVDLGGDLSDGSDSVKVQMTAKSGADYPVELSETDPHSGIFTGTYMLTYASGQTPAEEYNVKTQGFPVTYGDKVTVSYTDASGIATPAQHIDVREGADGSIAAFSKKYTDEKIAMRTQFALAEGYLEVAKHHRKLDEPKAAAREYARAKQLLSKAMNEFRDPETRAHAEYLLGNLTLEEANATEEGELQQQRYRAALSRFMDVAGAYSETLHASKAQFKIAAVYEKLGEPDIAAREYVKLAYKYPDSENLAVAMARLGMHFRNKAKYYTDQAEPLLDKSGNKDAQHEGLARQAMARQQYIKSARIFMRLQERFPNHDLAGKGGLLAGQAFMHAGDMKEALAAFQRVIANDSYDGTALRSPAMYWAGSCYQKLRQPMAAYSIFKRLTYDFPESKWAAYARGQLARERMLKLETKLEIERLEEGR